MQFTIETRELTNETSSTRSASLRSDQTTIEAPTVDDAISEFLLQNASELVSLSTLRPGSPESIATIRKDTAMYLLRVYAG